MEGPATTTHVAARGGPTVTSVIPTLNEAQNIGWVLKRLPDCVDEVIVVDGRSTDDTIAAALRARPDAKIVREPTPGKGSALRAGFARARGEIVVMLDADGSMEPSEIVRYVAKIEEGYELVKGSRFMPGGGTTDISRLRSLGNLVLLALANRLYRSSFTELCYGFMAFRRSAMERLSLTAEGFEIETQIVVDALRAGLRVVEVPSFEAERRSGTSNLRTVRDGTRVLRELLRASVSERTPRKAHRGDVRAGSSVARTAPRLLAGIFELPVEPRACRCARTAARPVSTARSR
jgi:glycosyltransferase involved in cell wall biosynthesis